MKITKITLVVLLSIFPNLIMSQSFCGQVEYTQIKNLGLPITEKYILKFNENESLAIESSHTDVKAKNKVVEQENERGTIERTNITVIPRSNKTPKFYFKSKNEFYFRDNFSDEVLLVKDSLPSFNWVLHNDSKKIGRFECQKATADFRGRSYIAWFANDIPVSYGPWKFSGLGGLILEIYDTEKVLYIRADSVVVENSTGCDLNSSDFGLDEAMSLDAYRDKKAELNNAIFAKLASKYPKGTIIPKWDKNCSDCNNRLEKSFNY
jgi:GLPGLI family protein